MDSFNKTNLQNIKDIFEKKTCVKLDSRRSFCSYKMVLVTAVLLILCLSTTAFAVNRFSKSHCQGTIWGFLLFITGMELHQSWSKIGRIKKSNSNLN